MSDNNSSVSSSAAIEKIDIMDSWQDILHGLKKFWWLVILLTVLFGGAQLFGTVTTYVPNYTASMTVAVKNVAATYDYVNQMSAEQIEKVFPYLMNSGVLRETIADDLGLESLPCSISASADPGTNFLTISVSGEDPEIVYNVLLKVPEDFPRVGRFVVGNIELQELDKSEKAEDTGKMYTYRGSVRNGAMKGCALGLLIMALYIVTRRTVKSRRELRKYVNLEDFGSIPNVKMKRRSLDKFKSALSLMNRRVPQGYLEAIRKLRVKVMKEIEAGGYKSLMLTSSVPGEGKSTLAVNLAIAIAKQGKHVILIDCDPRNPSVAPNMNDKGTHPGLAALVRRDVTYEEAVTRINLGEDAQGSLEIIYGGKPNNADAFVLGTRGMQKLIESLEKRCDLVILDTAPSELLADAPVLAKFVDAALYVVKYDCAKRSQIQDGVQSLAMSGTTIIGYVFNADMNVNKKNYGYGYNYGYGSAATKGHYGHYGHYADFSGKKERKDSAGRVFKA